MFENVDKPRKGTGRNGKKLYSCKKVSALIPILSTTGGGVIG